MRSILIKNFIFSKIFNAVWNLGTGANNNGLHFHRWKFEMAENNNSDKVSTSEKTQVKSHESADWILVSHGTGVYDDTSFAVTSYNMTHISMMSEHWSKKLMKRLWCILMRRNNLKKLIGRLEVTLLRLNFNISLGRLVEICTKWII